MKTKENLTIKFCPVCKKTTIHEKDTDSVNLKLFVSEVNQTVVFDVCQKCKVKRTDIYLRGFDDV